MNTATAHRRSPFLRGQARHWLGLGVLMLVLAGTANAADGSIKHGMIMRGHILEAEAGALVICVGEKDGAQVGQELDVVSHQRVTGTPKKAGPRYQRETVGRVRITSLFDDHYATAEIVEGKAQPHDTVELTH
jgi:hypothetical protein